MDRDEYYWARLRGREMTILKKVIFDDGEVKYYRLGHPADVTNYELMDKIEQYLVNPNWHPTAFVESNNVGESTKIWHYVHVRDGAFLGESCVIGRGVYIDTGVVVGDRVKIQNYACLYSGLTVEDDVFIGPHVCFTNDKHPRAFNTFVPLPTTVKIGASIGANSTIRTGITIGEYALIGCGSNVTKDCEPYGLYVGNPARLVAKVDRNGNVERYL